MIPTLVITEPLAEPPETLIARARECGASAVGLALGSHGGRIDALSMEECRRLREALAGLDHGISTVFVSFTPDSHFGSPQPAARRAASDQILAGLERAAWVGARVLVLDSLATVGADCTYAMALNGTHAALKRLRLEAERSGVELALVAPQSRFLLSPVELRNLLDEQHDPGVAAALDVPCCFRIGHPVDWIDCLGRRLSCILLHHNVLESASSTPALPADMRWTLGEAGFIGPVCSADPSILRGLTVA